jgi:trans-2-enoyl-CoA reductase
MSKHKSKKAKLDNLGTAWKNHAPKASFAGITLEQYAEKVQPSQDARDAETMASGQVKDAQANRDNADAQSMKVQQQVISAIKGDPNFGEDSPLYQAAGYVRKSDKKSGLSRKTTKPAASEKKTA